MGKEMKQVVTMELTMTTGGVSGKHGTNRNKLDFVQKTIITPIGIVETIVECANTNVTGGTPIVVQIMMMAMKLEKVYMVKIKEVKQRKVTQIKVVTTELTMTTGSRRPEYIHM